MIDEPISVNLRTALEVVEEAARGAGRILLDRFETKHKTSFKGRGNLVSEADLLAEASVLKLLKEEYPDFHVISEESGVPAHVSGLTWVVDPLDGTNNYVFGIPFFCVNVALVKDGQVLLGVTYDPNRNELFSAVCGKGAHLNNRQMAVSTRAPLQLSLVALDLGYNDILGRELIEVVRKLWPGVHSLRLMGSASLGLAYVACGRIDLYFHRFLYPWDIASGILLAREAGGIITDWKGKDVDVWNQSVIAGNAAVHSEFIRAFSD